MPDHVRRAGPATALLRGMGMLARCGSALLTALLPLFLLTTHAVLVFAWRPPEVRALPDRVPLVVVLGGDPLRRYETGVRLVEEGRADWIHFTGGEVHKNTAGAQIMVSRARERLPNARVTFEDRSENTLQNALFTVDAIGPLPSGAVLVSDATHLFRSWGSFVWAGSGPLEMMPSSSLAEIPAHDRPRRVLREAVAVWLNVGRALRYKASRLGGSDRLAAAELLAEP